jgi:hypothetical protein
VKAVTPPAGVEARDCLVPGVVIEWVVQTSPGAEMRYRLHGPRAEETNRNGRVVQPFVPARVEARTGVASFGPDFTDPDELERFAWRRLRAELRLASVLRRGMPDPPPDPQRTIHDHLAESGTPPTIPTGIVAPAPPEDEGVCPDDPDGLHHAGCGCDYASPDDPPVSVGGA